MAVILSPTSLSLLRARSAKDLLSRGCEQQILRFAQDDGAL